MFGVAKPTILKIDEIVEKPIIFTILEISQGQNIPWKNCIAIDKSEIKEIYICTNIFFKGYLQEEDITVIRGNLVLKHFLFSIY